MILIIAWAAVAGLILTLALPAAVALWEAWVLFALIALTLFGYWLRNRP